MADFYAGAPDTVVSAAADPDREQPWAELGLAPEEYERIKGVLARRPTEAELAMYSVMWSEHCSYKSSKVHLEKFRELPKSERLLAGIGANAGVVDVGQGLAVTFKVESHNHPSFVEPYQGAATGIGGIVRDILAMGARPIAVMDSLRFGDADAPDTRRVVRGVVSGIGGYGNSLGLPNVGGEVVFDPSYDGNPLVNALCLGVLDKERLQVGEAAGVGNKVILYGAKTGRDGIGGASVLASASFDAPLSGSAAGEAAGGSRGPARRPAVQVGDPFQEKIVTECTLELYDKGLVIGISDFGAAGLACAISETAASADTGMTVTLDAVPLREASMEAWEILISESQERMLAIVAPASVEEALATCARWGVLATVIGEVTDGQSLIVEWHGETIVDVPPASLAQDGPVYHRPLERPDSQDDLVDNVPDSLARPGTGDELRATLLSMAGSSNLCSKKWVTEQYDRYVRGNTVLAHPDDAGIIRLSETSNLGVAMATDGNGRFARLDPYAGAQLALLEACRNVATTGAVPYAVTDCLNFGSPEDPAVMWQFAEAIQGIADGCEALELPMTGGNVSFYNSTAGTPINPTPVLGVLGLLQDVTRHTPMGFSAPHHEIWLLGTTEEEFGGSEWAWHTHRHLGGTPPAVDLDAEEALWRLLTEGATAGLFRSAHDLSDGGLAQALVECTLRNGVGARVSLDDDPFVTLFSESAARVLVSVAVEDAVALLDLAWLRGVPFEEIGVTGGKVLSVEGQFSLPLEELRVAHEETLPRVFG